jgi:putative flippase GtrA
MSQQGRPEWTGRAAGEVVRDRDCPASVRIERVCVVRLFQGSFVRFGLVSILSVSVNIGLTALLHEIFHFSAELAFAIALGVVMAQNFLLSRYYVYDGRSGNPAHQMALFVVSSLGFRGGEYVAFIIGHTWLGAPYLPTILGVLMTSFLIKFFYYRCVVFERKPAGDIL